MLSFNRVISIVFLLVFGLSVSAQNPFLSSKDFTFITVTEAGDDEVQYSGGWQEAIKTVTVSLANYELGREDKFSFTVKVGAPKQYHTGVWVPSKLAAHRPQTIFPQT